MPPVVGDRPARSWVEAATGGDPRFGPEAPAIRCFHLFDRQGACISPGGVPAGIGTLDGTRLLVLHPPNGTYALDVGRVFEHMVPELRLDRIPDPVETGRWLALSAPAVENDLMADQRSSDRSDTEVRAGPCPARGAAEDRTSSPWSSHEPPSIASGHPAGPYRKPDQSRCSEGTAYGRPPSTPAWLARKANDSAERDPGSGT